MKLAKPIDLEKSFFHGLRNNDHPLKLHEHSFLRLEKILQSDAILSRNKQIETFGQSFDSYHLDSDENGVKCKERTNWNGSDAISVCRRIPNLNPFDSGYDLFVKYYLSILLDEHVIELPANTSNRRQLDELQIMDSIPKKFFVGIGVGDLFHSEKRINEIKEIINRNQCDLPLISLRSGNEI